MNNINKEAQNEVQALLNELVVSPVEENLREELSKVESAIKELHDPSLKDIQRSIRGMSSSIDGNLNTIVDTVNEIKGIADGNLVKLKGLENQTSDISKAIKQIEATSQQLENLKKVVSQISSQINEKKQNLIGQLKSSNEFLSKIQKNMVVQSALSSEFEIIQTKLSEIETMISLFNDDFANTMSGIPQQITEISELVPSVKSNSENIERYYHSLSATLSRIDNSMMTKNKEIADQFEQMSIKSNKNLSLVVLLSVFNLLGLIAVLVIQFLH